MAILYDQDPKPQPPVRIFEPPPPEPPDTVRRMYLASNSENRAFVNILAAWIVQNHPRIAIVSRWHTLPPTDDLHLRWLMDKTDLERADSLMLVEPCGVNSSGEYSWAVAKGLTTVYYQDYHREDDVLNMSVFATHRARNIYQLTTALKNMCVIKDNVDRK